MVSFAGFYVSKTFIGSRFTHVFEVACPVNYAGMPVGGVCIRHYNSDFRYILFNPAQAETYNSTFRIAGGLVKKN